ncbi:MAG: hypothetical protein K0S65_2611 [Labilithrix sp.]|nr:hypothetical protein [Labilithrix sp.]
MFSVRFASRALCPLVAATTLAGCGGGPESRTPKNALQVTNPFPTKTALDELAKKPVISKPARSVAVLPGWRVDASDLADSSLAERRYGEAGGGLRFTRELRCVARELGRLRAENGADADERIEHFIVGACGLSTTAGVATFHLTGDVPANVSDEQLLDAWKGQLTVPPAFKGRTAGAWVTRKGTHAILMLVAAQYESDVVVSAAAPTGKVTVQGTAPPDAEQVLALVNQGQSGVGHCEPDRGVALPRFTFTCTMNDGDPWAWIEVATRKSGRVLLRPTAIVVARRDPRAPLEITRTAISSPAPPNGTIESAVLEGINEARTNAKLGTVTLAPKQATVNARVAPHFFNAEVSGDGRTGETVALGLLAGWDVEGTIRKGNFFGTMLTGTKDPARWTEYALEHPLGRLSLLEPDARQIAIGVAPPDDVGGIGAVVTTYAFFGNENHQANSARVMARLGEERAARKLAAPTALGDLPTLVTEARLVNAGQREPMAALGHALDAESQRLGQSMRGWVIVTNDLDDLPFPKELLAPGPLSVRVVVTHYRPEGAAWGAYLIYFVAPAPAPQQVAATHPAHPTL